LDQHVLNVQAIASLIFQTVAFNNKHVDTQSQVPMTLQTYTKLFSMTIWI